MTGIPGQAPVVRVKPQPDIYSLLLILGILALAGTVVYLAHHLMTVYGLTFGELFTGQTIPV